ncbi:MAG: exodeoxyribonuclease III [Oscillatoriales cyanobacterium SM2_2_1]|nr:exodeoxyribonuclease III [Oscillatoriales cyanobacterium SM2_2_1]
MYIATWNVNSIRARLDHLIAWLGQHPELDVLCVQETKVVDGDFPVAAIAELGWHCAFYGQKTYNGVAILSRTPLAQVAPGFVPVLGSGAAAWDEQKRLLMAETAGYRILNLYVPNGSAVGSDKYHYKLEWLALLRQYLEHLNPQTLPLVILGDFNVAFTDLDLHDPGDREQKIMATEAERQAWQGILGLGLLDGFRLFTTDGGHYTWWDYRGGAFRRNHGWRIDYILISQWLQDRAIACTIDPTPRHWAQPSDHTPVIMHLENWQAA